MADPRGAAPRLADLADRLGGAMVASEPVEPLAWAVARDQQGRGLYLVAVVMGSQNVDEFADALAKLKPNMKPVDIFDEPAGAEDDEPPADNPG